MMSRKGIKISAEICRILLGGVFIFSGFVKAVDPLGSAYKFQEYFSVFGMPWMEPATLVASFVLSAFEFSLGVSVLLGISRRFTSVLTFLFMSFMTLLTLYSAIVNPVTDCGCFGDALVLTNWETFYKNIILLLASVFLLKWKKYIIPVLTEKLSWFGLLWSYIFIFSISFYCFFNLPIFDFRPYKIGTNIPQSMEIPEGFPHDKYETTFIYEKSGVRKEFTVDNYPANDSSWTFVDARTKLVAKGYIPPIHDFSIMLPDKSDITDIILADTSYTFLLISYSFDQAEDSNIDIINEVYDYARMYNYKFYCLTASPSESVSDWIENMGAEYSICTSDETTLKTIIRSNPGLLLLKNGTIINKWHYRNIPQEDKLNKSLSSIELGKIPPDHTRKKIIYSVIALFLPLGLIFLFDYLLYRRKRKEEKKIEIGDII